MGVPVLPDGAGGMKGMIGDGGLGCIRPGMGPGSPSNGMGGAGVKRPVPCGISGITGVKGVSGLRAGRANGSWGITGGMTGPSSLCW